MAWAPPTPRVGVGASLFGQDLGLPPLDLFNPMPALQSAWDTASSAVQPVQQAISAVLPTGVTHAAGAGLTQPGEDPSQKPYGALTPLNKPASSLIPLGGSDEPTRVNDANVAYHGQRAADIADGVEPTPGLADPSQGDLVSGWEEFGNAHLNALFDAAGLGGATSAACGPVAIAGTLRAFGIDVDPATIARKGQDTRRWSASLGMLAGDGSAVSSLLGDYGVANQNLPADWNNTKRIADLVQQGVPVIFNGPQHYLLAQDYNPATGQFFVGATGSNALKGGSDWMTLDQMSASPGVGGAIESFIVPTSVPQSTVGARSKQRFTPQAGSDPGSPREIGQRLAQEFGVPFPILDALVTAESNWNPGAVGDQGNSIGLLQNNMAGGRGAGSSAAQLYDPEYNLRLGLQEIAPIYQRLYAQGYRGAQLAREVGRLAQRPAAGNEVLYEQAYQAAYG